MRLSQKVGVSLLICLCGCGGFIGYHQLKYVPVNADELASSGQWDNVLYGMAEEIPDIRVGYAVQTEMDINMVARGDLASSVVIPNTIPTFNISKYLDDGKEAEVEQTTPQQPVNNYTGQTNTTTQTPQATRKKKNQVSSVPQRPTQQFATPTGQWCVYQGKSSGLIKAFDPNDFPAKYRKQCQEAYNKAINQKQSEILFDNEKEKNQIAYILQTKYSMTMGMVGSDSSGKIRGYFLGIQNNQMNSASHAERIVQQLFPNGATAKDVVWGCCNWLAQHTRYNAGIPSSEVLFTQGQGNCNAFASALKQMCNAMGVTCNIIAGQAYNGYWGGHAWNVVNINGANYQVDACFYATSGNGAYVLSPSIWSDHRNGVVNNGYITM